MRRHHPEGVRPFARTTSTRIVDTAEDAKRMVVELIPEGAEVHSVKSKTL